MSNISLATTIDPAIADLNAARSGLLRVGQPLLFSLGMIGCLLNIVIFLRPSMRINSCAIYFHASSWANFFCLTWGLLIGILVNFVSNDPLPYNAAYCKIRFYMLTASQLASRACVVLACLDRFLLCSQSVQQRSFCRPSVAIKVVSITILACACLSSYVLIVYDAFSETRQCTTSSAAGKILDSIILFVFNFGIPAIMMITLSSLFLWRLKQNSKRIDRQRIQVRTKDVQLAAMLIGQVILYIITALPFVSNMAYIAATQNIPSSNKSAYRIAAESLAITATGAFGTFLFNSLSFYVYTLTAPGFRRELFSLLVPKRWINNNLQQRQQLSRTNHIYPSHQTNM